MRLIPMRLFVVVGATLVLGIGGGIAVADIPSSADGTISACMLKPGGAIRLIDAEAGATCKKLEQEVEWNVQGVPGQDGVLAPDDLYVRSATVSSDYPDGSHGVRADCDTGDTLLGADGVAVLDSSRWTLDRVSNAGPVRGMLLRVWPTEAGVDPVGNVRSLCLDTAP